jgi:hypothetical protein
MLAAHIMNRRSAEDIEIKSAVSLPLSSSIQKYIVDESQATITALQHLIPGQDSSQLAS